MQQSLEISIHIIWKLAKASNSSHLLQMNQRLTTSSLYVIASALSKLLRLLWTDATPKDELKQVQGQ
jgi:hypothetical protein